MKKTLLYTLLSLTVALFISGCSDVGTGGTNPEPGIGLTMTDVARGTFATSGGNIDSIRDRWLLVSMTATESAQYLIGVKPSTASRPTSNEMSNDINVKKYTVGTTPINVILATTMGSRMLSYFDGTNNQSAVYVDTALAGATGCNCLSNANENLFRDSMLAPNTSHHVYGMKVGENIVSRLITLTTDRADYSITTTSGATTTAPELNTNTITVHNDNFEIFPLNFIYSNYNAVKIHTADGPPGYQVRILNQSSLQVNPIYVGTNHKKFLYVVTDGQPANTAIPRNIYLMVTSIHNYPSTSSNFYFQHAYSGYGSTKYDYIITIQK